MEVKLVVTNGRHSGREIPIKGPKFFIGRAEDCHLRPGSDLVSRHHCVLLIEDGSVTIRDFGSKNGTFVNGEQVMPERELNNGDHLLVGQLEFDVQISGAPTAKPKADRPPASSGPGPDTDRQESKTVAARQAKTAKVDDDLDISQWFGDSGASAKTDTKTVDMSTMRAEQSTDTKVDREENKEDAKEGDDSSLDVSEAEKERRRREGLVGVSKARQASGVQQTTQDAAAEMLKKFFSGRK